MAIHHYRCAAEWTGAATGPTDQPRFNRNIQVTFAGRPALEMSSPPEFLGTAERVSPEELFVASLATCQMLTYLALAARQGIVVTAYHDEAEGEMMLQGGRMRFTKVTLHPAITIAAGADPQAAQQLIERAHHDCFIGNSVTTELMIEPQPIQMQ
jgi:organic hydroperoxide reductase OsmC/OhrA